MDFIRRFLKGDYLALAHILPGAIGILVWVAVLLMNSYTEAGETLGMTLINRTTS